MTSKENKQQRFILITIINIGLGLSGFILYRLFNRPADTINSSQAETSINAIASSNEHVAMPAIPVEIAQDNNPIQPQRLAGETRLLRFSHARWLIPLVILAIVMLQEYWTYLVTEPFGITELWMAVAEIITLLLFSGISVYVLKLTQWLRRHTLLWSFLAVACILLLLMQREIHQRVYPNGSGFYLAFSVWSYILVFFYGATRDEFRQMGRQLAQSPWTGLLISFITIVLILISIEVLLRNVFFFTNSYAHGLIHRRWDREYWHPLNELTFRDYEIGRDPGDSVIRTLVLGDSFAAGFGVQTIEQTFPHLLQDDLGDDYHVYLVAHAGWNTDSQVRDLPTYPIPPDLIIHSYFLNDISYLSGELLAQWHAIIKAPAEAINTLVDNFYIAEFLYYNIYLQYMAGGDASYNSGILASYLDDRFWIPHSEDLIKLLDYAKLKDSDYLVLLWPSLANVEGSRQITDKVAGFYHEQGISVINLAEDLRFCASRDLVVNPFDAHPSPRTHQFAADRLYEFMTTGELEPVTECPLK